MTAVRVVGLDLSLRSAGVARVTVDHNDDGDVVVLGSHTETVGSSSSDRMDVAGRWLRLDHLATRIVTACGETPDLVVVEGPSFGQAQQQHATDMAGLRWLIYDRLMTTRLLEQVAPGTARGLLVDVVEVAPATLKVYATGNGKADKAAVLWGIRASVGHLFDIAPTGAGRFDIADAVTLAALGAAGLGYPLIPDAPRVQARAVDVPRWPDRLSHARAHIPF